MTPEELESWAEDFEAFHGRFAYLFARSEPREQAAKYMRGLLGPVARKNGWQLVEAIGDDRPDKTQRLLYSTNWDMDAARDELQRFVVEVLGDEDGIGVVDESGFLKKGPKSVGVKRQYSGTAGKVENCQIGDFLSMFRPGASPFWIGVCTCPRSGVMIWNGEQKRRCRPRSSFAPSHSKRQRC